MIYAADPGDSAGAVASGDFNGDGTIDVAVAAAAGDGPGNERADSGEAYVFLGPFSAGEVRDAAAGDQAMTVYGADAGDQLGRSVAAGDVNGDGGDDLVFGAPFGDGPAGDRQDAGEVHVVYGSPTLTGAHGVVDLQNAAGFVVYGRAPGELAGFSVATANLNGDEARDVVIGAFSASGAAPDRTLAGAVYIVFGTAEVIAGVDVAADEQDVIVYGASAEGRLGEEVGAGDVNGDGLEDLILPAPFAPGSTGIEAAGRTYVVNSPPSPSVDLASGANAIIYGVDDGDQLGHVVATGDVDGDALADILLTAVSADGPENGVDLAGEAVLVYGASLDAQVDVAQGAGDAVIYGADETDRLGRSAAIADIDGDGRADLLAGAPGGAGPEETTGTAGELYVIFADKVSRNLRLPEGALVHYGTDAGDSLASEVFGRRPLAAADVNEDGRNEIIVVAPQADGPENGRLDSGEVYVLFPSRR